MQKIKNKNKKTDNKSRQEIITYIKNEDANCWNPDQTMQIQKFKASHWNHVQEQQTTYS